MPEGVAPRSETNALLFRTLFEKPFDGEKCLIGTFFSPPENVKPREGGGACFEVSWPTTPALG